MRYLFSIILSLLFTGFCTIPKKVPEVSPDIIYKPILNEDTVSPVAISGNFGNNLFVFSEEGSIYSLNPVKLIPEKVIHYREKLIKKLFSQNGITALQTAHPSKIVLFDSQSLKLREITHRQGKISGIFKEYYLSLSGKELILKDYVSGTTVRKFNIPGGKFFNAEMVNQMLIILMNRSFVIYDIKRDKEDIITLSNKPSSPFLYSEGLLYYGSENRKLIKFSLRKRKVLWKIDVPMKIERKILGFGKFIIVLPKDRSIYFFTKRGTLYWWKKLDSDVLSTPVPMRKNISLHLKDVEKEKIVFLNPGKKTEKTIILEDLSLWGNMIFFKGYIFSIAKKSDNDKDNILLKIGNKIGGIVKLPEDTEFETGKSIKISVKPVNMFKPEINISISDSEGKVLFAKKYISGQKISIAWIPYSEGDYKINVTLTEKGLKIREDEINIKVNDLHKIYKKYFLYLIRECSII